MIPCITCVISEGFREAKLLRLSFSNLFIIESYTKYKIDRHRNTEHTISRSSKNRNNVGSMCNMSGQCAWPGLQLNFYNLAAVTTGWGTNSAHLQLNN